MFFCLPVTSPLVVARVWFHGTTNLFCKIPVLTKAQWLLELMDLRCLYFHSSCLYWFISVATNSMGLWNLVHAGRSCLRNPYFPWHCSVSVLCRMPYIPFSHPWCVLLGCFDSVPLCSIRIQFLGLCFSGNLENSCKEVPVQNSLSLPPPFIQIVCSSSTFFLFWICNKLL